MKKKERDELAYVLEHFANNLERAIKGVDPKLSKILEKFCHDGGDFFAIEYPCDHCRKPIILHTLN